MSLSHVEKCICPKVQEGPNFHFEILTLCTIKPLQLLEQRGGFFFPNDFTIPAKSPGLPGRLLYFDCLFCLNCCHENLQEIEISVCDQAALTKKQLYTLQAFCKPIPLYCKRIGEAFISMYSRISVMLNCSRHEFTKFPSQIVVSIRPTFEFSEQIS